MILKSGMFLIAYLIGMVEKGMPQIHMSTFSI